MKAVSSRRLGASLRKRVKAKTGSRCHVCGAPLRAKWTADHVRPRARGGADAENNYLPCCGVCNDARWHRSSRTIRKMLRLGMYLLPEIKKNSTLGRSVMALHRSRRAKNKARRRKSRNRSR